MYLELRLIDILKHRLIEVSARELGLGERERRLLHHLSHRLLRLHDLPQDLPEAHLQRVRLALQQLVALLGGLQAPFHERLGAARRENVDAVLARHVLSRVGPVGQQIILKVFHGYNFSSIGNDATGRQH